MSGKTGLDLFKDVCDEWLCDQYTLDLRFIAHIDDAGNVELLTAGLTFYPIPFAQDIDVELHADGLYVGRIRHSRVKKARLNKVLENALNGTIEAFDQRLTVGRDIDLSHIVELLGPGSWYSEPALRVAGNKPISLPVNLLSIDEALRHGERPFDGLDDVVRWLGVADPRQNRTTPHIEIKLSPPADLIFDEMSLLDDKLSLTVHAHPRLAKEAVGLAVIGSPDIGDASRQQVGSSILWARAKAGRKVGKISVDIPSADQVLAILSIGASTVRRHWIGDPARSRNARYVIVQHLDNNLSQIRKALLESRDAPRFETAVAALLFLRGFTPSVQIETESPDIVVTTPAGQIALVECTLAVKDVPTKIGKLVDRRRSVAKALQASGHTANVLAVLICQLPLDQIAANQAQILEHGIYLVTAENLANELIAARGLQDPDKVFNDLAALLNTKVPP